MKLKALVAALALAAILPVAALADEASPSDKANGARACQAEVRFADEPKLTTHVDNVGNVPVDRMQILVERLDAGGAVVGTSRAWVMGVVVPLHRTHFTARVAPAASYRVSILTFDWSNCRD